MVPTPAAPAPAATSTPVTPEAPAAKSPAAKAVTSSPSESKPASAGGILPTPTPIGSTPTPTPNPMPMPMPVSLSLSMLAPSAPVAPAIGGGGAVGNATVAALLSAAGAAAAASPDQPALHAPPHLVHHITPAPAPAPVPSPATAASIYSTPLTSSSSPVHLVPSPGAATAAQGVSPSSLLGGAALLPLPPYVAASSHPAPVTPPVVSQESPPVTGPTAGYWRIFPLQHFTGTDQWGRQSTPVQYPAIVRCAGIITSVRCTASRSLHSHSLIARSLVAVRAAVWRRRETRADASIRHRVEPHASHCTLLVVVVVVFAGQYSLSCSTHTHTLASMQATTSRELFQALSGFPGWAVSNLLQNPVYSVCDCRCCCSASSSRLPLTRATLPLHRCFSRTPSPIEQPTTSIGIACSSCT